MMPLTTQSIDLPQPLSRMVISYLFDDLHVDKEAPEDPLNAIFKKYHRIHFAQETMFVLSRASLDPDLENWKTQIDHSVHLFRDLTLAHLAPHTPSLHSNEISIWTIDPNNAHPLYQLRSNMTRSASENKLSFARFGIATAQIQTILDKDDTITFTYFYTSLIRYIPGYGSCHNANIEFITNSTPSPSASNPPTILDSPLPVPLPIPYSRYTRLLNLICRIIRAVGRCISHLIRRSIDLLTDKGFVGAITSVVMLAISIFLAKTSIVNNRPPINTWAQWKALPSQERTVWKIYFATFAVIFAYIVLEVGPTLSRWGHRSFDRIERQGSRLCNKFYFTKLALAFIQSSHPIQDIHDWEQVSTASKRLNTTRARFEAAKATDSSANIPV